MSTTPEENIKAAFGEQAFTIAVLLSERDQAHERVGELEKLLKEAQETINEYRRPAAEPSEPVAS